MKVFRVLVLTAAAAALLFPQSFTSMLEAPQGFDVGALDKKADPCVDFYQFSCGTWMANNPIPPDRSRWGRFDVLRERNDALLRDILEAAMKAGSAAPPHERQIGDYYAACMDEEAIEKKGIAPIQPELKRIRSISNKQGLTDAAVRLHRVGIQAVFAFGSGADYKNSKQVIARADQGGLGLPDRDYYLNADARSVEIRDKYLSHVRKMFELAGDPADVAAVKARAVVRIETALAEASMDRVARRNPDNTYHKMQRVELRKLAPSFAWNRYFQASGAPPFDSLNVASPQFFKGMEAVIQQNPLDDWKAYLNWHVLRSTAPLLPRAFVEENFEFYGRTLTGAQELRPRWKRCVSMTDSDLGEALGRGYVERAFAGDSKERMLQLVAGIQKAFERNLETLDWMSPETKKRAREKLDAVANKIGYPENWRDYSAIKIERGDAMGNALRASEFERQRQLSKINGPVDPTEWRMTPPTVNAYYSPLENNINFPAGILQPPFFDPRLDDAVNLGAIGGVIGHELTHGFDDSGRRFDADGNLRDWWTAEDAKGFEERAECIVQQYGSYVVVDDVTLNGRLSLGENVADNGGVRLAHMALMDMSAGKPAQKIDGFTPEQRFFLGWGQIWCQNQTPEAARMQATVGPHSTGRYRVNGVVSNSPEFQKAFACREGQPMVHKNACRVW